MFPWDVLSSVYQIWKCSRRKMAFNNSKHPVHFSFRTKTSRHIAFRDLLLRTRSQHTMTASYLLALLTKLKHFYKSKSESSGASATKMIFSLLTERIIQNSLRVLPWSIIKPHSKHSCTCLVHSFVCSKALSFKNHWSFQSVRWHLRSFQISR